MKHAMLEQKPSISLFESFANNSVLICNHYQTIKQ